jgi:hypothetical protein
MHTPAHQHLVSLESFDVGGEDASPAPASAPHRQRGFCFAEFSSHEAAHDALKSLSRSPCPLPELLEAEGGSLKVDWFVLFFRRWRPRPHPSPTQPPATPPPPPPPSRPSSAAGPSRSWRRPQRS